MAARISSSFWALRTREVTVPIDNQWPRSLDETLAATPATPPACRRPACVSSGFHHQRLALLDQRLRQRHLEFALGELEALHFALGRLARLILGDQAHIDAEPGPGMRGQIADRACRSFPSARRASARSEIPADRTGTRHCRRSPSRHPACRRVRSATSMPATP